MTCKCGFKFSGAGEFRNCDAFIDKEGRSGIICPVCKTAYLEGTKVKIKARREKMKEKDFIKIVIEYIGKIPTINNMYSTNRYGRRFISSSHKKFKEDMQILALPYKHKKIEGKIKVWIGLKFGRRGRDITNVDKAVLDAFQGILYDNDNQITMFTVELLKNNEIKAEEGMIIKLEKGK